LSRFRSQPRINTFHHPEKLFGNAGDDDEDNDGDAA
jgi:hypothetical protein